MGEGSSPGSPEGGIIYIGSDKLYFERNRLLIHATVPMNWPTREYCRVPIFVQDRKFYLRGRYPAKRPYRMIYELWPWPNNLHEHSNESVSYDVAYVRERNRLARHERGLDLLDPLLFPSYPVLGLFWSRFKNRVFRPAGFEPHGTTAFSVFMVSNLFVLQAVSFGYLGGGWIARLLDNPSYRSLDWICLAVLGCDTVFRARQCFRADLQNHWGFCEWLVPAAWIQRKR